MEIVLWIFGVAMFAVWVFGDGADVFLILANIYIVASMVVAKIEEESKKPK